MPHGAACQPLWGKSFATLRKPLENGTLAPVTSESGTVAQRLRAAINETAGMSVRRLGILLAERKGTKAESERRTIGKWLKGEIEPDDENAAHLAHILKTPPGHFRALRPSNRLRSVEALAAHQAEQLQELTLAVYDLRDRLEALESRTARRTRAQ